MNKICAKTNSFCAIMKSLIDTTAFCDVIPSLASFAPIVRLVEEVNYKEIITITVSKNIKTNLTAI